MCCDSVVAKMGHSCKDDEENEDGDDDEVDEDGGHDEDTKDAEDEEMTEDGGPPGWKRRQ